MGRVVVHLVHGTWPYGPFRRSKPKKPTGWFDEGSSVRKALQKASGNVAEFVEFPWSGKNSFAARQEAALGLRKHLDESLKKDSDAMHVLVAHSHGGTVVAGALSSSGLWKVWTGSVPRYASRRHSYR